LQCNAIALALLAIDIGLVITSKIKPAYLKSAAAKDNVSDSDGSKTPCTYANDHRA
jgi:hypothetical protein